MKSGGRCDNIHVTNIIEKYEYLDEAPTHIVGQLPKAKIDPERTLAVLLSGILIFGPLCIGAIAVSEWLR